MSPKKTVKNPTPRRKITEKMPKRTVKKEKPKPNMPANIKVSIPFTTKPTEEGIHVPIIRGRGPPRFKKKLDFETKVELANSVARQQLMKEEAPKLETNRHENVVKSPRRGRQKQVQVVSNFFQNRVVIGNNNTEAVVSTTTIKSPEKKAEKPAPTRRIVTRKRLADSTAEQAAKKLKAESSAESETVKIKLEENPTVDDPVVQENGLSIQPQTIIVEQIPVIVQPLPIVEQPKPKVMQPTPAVQPQPTPPVQPQPMPTVVQPQRPVKNKTKPAAKRPRPASKKPPAMKQPAARKKRAPKGKKEIVVEGDESPSILDQLKKLPKKEPEAEVKNLTVPKTPGPVESRKTSVSSNSNLSWTKDISSSSTTTCITVSSNDFVRFNKKLPVLKLTNIDNEWKKKQNDVEEAMNEDDDDSSSSSDSDSSDSDTKYSEQYDPIEISSLHLSASSPPSSRFSQTLNKEASSLEYAKAAERLSLTLKKVDMEMINWISSDNEEDNANLEKFKDKMFDILDIEFGVITHCRRLKEILDPPKIENETCFSEPVKDNNADIETMTAPVEEITQEVEFVKPRPCRKLSSVSDGNASVASNKVARDDSPEHDTPAGSTKTTYPYYPSYDQHDDDDALSLFAESITGFESSRMNTSIASVPIINARAVEEYIPKPLKEDSVPNTEKQTYHPTRIREEAEMFASKIKTIIEKQNADSTSVYKQSNSTDDTESYQDFHEHTDLDTRIGPPEVIKKPRLMASLFEGLPKAKSIVFGNLCFYNLRNCCRKKVFGQCRFLHVVPSSDQIKAKLHLLNERTLIQEYLLLRNWADLRRRYGMCYVEECSNRGLTRILVEMAYDFIVKAKNESEADTRLRVDTIEAALLHLNTVDLSICEDLLTVTIHADEVNRTLLCDVFMATMSITQNFSRFKIVFLNLTYFMVDNDRTFNKDVVEHILERVCILPFEEPVARALIQMMRLTKSDIFKNSMIGHFEKQISMNKDVFEEYSLLKNQCAFTSLLASSVLAGSSPEPRGEGQPPAPSPDTTNLDNLNKTAEEPTRPVITRTIGMNPPVIFNRGQQSPTKAHDTPGTSRTHNSSGSPNSDDTSNQSIRKWRNRAIFPHLMPPPMAEQAMMRAPIRTPLRPMRPHMRVQRMPFNQRLVTFRSPINYGNRQPGPKY